MSELFWRAGLVFVAVASHGVLDAATDGGLGVGFWIPFETSRYFLPWRPIPVSPIGIDAFFTSRGLEILIAEARWIWAPTAACVVVLLYLRRLAARAGEAR
jgi:inner membrane protein